MQGANILKIYTRPVQHNLLNKKENCMTDIKISKSPASKNTNKAGGKVDLLRPAFQMTMEYTVQLSYRAPVYILGGLAYLMI